MACDRTVSGAGQRCRACARDHGLCAPHRRMAYAAGGGMMLTLFAALKSARWAFWLYQNRAWLKWLAIGLAFVVVTGLWRWERHDRIAAATTARAATERLVLAQEDVA